MISEKLSVIIIGLLFINYIIIWYIKDNAYKKGVKKGEFADYFQVQTDF